MMTNQSLKWSQWLTDCSESGLHEFARETRFPAKKTEDSTSFRQQLIGAARQGMFDHYNGTPLPETSAGVLAAATVGKSAARPASLDAIINHPSHYQSISGLEAIDVIEAFKLGFNLGNAVKYILRAGRKTNAGALEDLKKAVWYLEREQKTCEK